MYTAHINEIYVASVILLNSFRSHLVDRVWTSSSPEQDAPAAANLATRSKTGGQQAARRRGPSARRAWRQPGSRLRLLRGGARVALLALRRASRARPRQASMKVDYFWSVNANCIDLLFVYLYMYTSTTCSQLTSLTDRSDPRK